MEQTPEYFLDLIRQSRIGRLKVYIGMIAGVGKTCRMLQEAHDLLKAGVNVKIGFVETHGREETETLLKGLPEIPRKKVFYKGKELEEMDLEAILTERPEVVIVDELPHTNIPGSKNEKRWQDVLELVEAGINVITAFNVQHLDSLNDKVYTITGIEVSERVPDKILEQADEIVNIDLPAEDLIQRLKVGKIYKGDKIQRALANFFQPDKILQLRDLALRQVAKQLEQKIETTIQSPSKISAERFMACISANDAGAKKIIRKTARLASYYGAEWLVVYVQSRRESLEKIDLRLQRKLLNNLKTATELGAKVLQFHTSDLQQTGHRSLFRNLINKGLKLIESDKTNIPDILYKAAIDYKVSNIVIGRPNQSLWRAIIGRNYFAKLMRRLSDTDIDLIVVS